MRAILFTLVSFCAVHCLALGGSHDASQPVNRAISPASVTTEDLTVNKTTVLNESGGDNDTRIESDTNTDAWRMQASDGNVGMGTGSPNAHLHMEADSAGLNFETHVASKPRIGFYKAGDSEFAAIYGSQTVAGQGYLFFVTSAATRMAIKPGGSVGVGTTSPSEILGVAGNIAVSGTVDGHDIDGEFTQITTDTTTLETNLSSTATALATLTSQVATDTTTLETNLSSTATALAALTSQVATDTTTLETNLSSTATALAALTSSVATDTTTLETNLSSTATALAALTSSVATDTTTLETNLSSTATALAALTSSVATDTTTLETNLSSTATALATHIAVTGSSAHGAVSAATADQIVVRNAQGNFAATVVTATLSGLAATATALAADPTDCTNEYATTIAANGNLSCSEINPSYVAGGDLPTDVIASSVGANGVRPGSIVTGGINASAQFASGVVDAAAVAADALAGNEIAAGTMDADVIASSTSVGAIAHVNQLGDMACADNEILKWNDGAGTWGCEADDSGGGDADIVFSYSGDIYDSTDTHTNGIKRTMVKAAISIGNYKIYIGSATTDSFDILIGTAPLTGSKTAWTTLDTITVPASISSHTVTATACSLSDGDMINYGFWNVTAADPAGDITIKVTD